MLKKDAQVGKLYEAKVSNKLTTIRLDRALSRGGWIATNMATGREIRIRTAGKLRKQVDE